jgi:hypothetical protein
MDFVEVRFERCRLAYYPPESSRQPAFVLSCQAASFVAKGAAYFDDSRGCVHPATHAEHSDGGFQNVVAKPRLSTQIQLIALASRQ